MKRYFISDLHLTPERPDITRAFLSFMERISPQADELYLLGDIFEAWIGDDGPLDVYQPIIQALMDASQSTRLFFQHGNRDFLVGPAFANLTGMTLLPDAYCVDLPTGKALLMHGDQLCTDDVEYQQFRTMVRNPTWQANFLGQTVQERLTIARKMRAASQAQGAMKANDIMDVNPKTVREVMLEHSVETLIHGHTHRPCIHQNQISHNRGTRIVLGDWDNKLWYLVSDEQSLTLIDEDIEPSFAY